MRTFRSSMGSWEVSSVSDPRWNKSGRGEGLATSCGPSDINNWIDKCRETLGAIPTDIQTSFIKD